MNQEGFWSNITGALGRGTDWEVLPSLKSDESEKGAFETSPEKYSIMLDMLGKGFDPKNPFAGIGTAMGKSSLASKAETAGQKRSMEMFNRMLEAFTAKDKPGPTSMLTSLSPDGRGIDYKISGIEGLEEPTKTLGVETPKILTEEDFASRFGGGF